MKRFVVFLLVLLLAGSFLAVPVFAWDHDEVYEHNRRVREELESLEMCEDMRAFFTLPIMYGDIRHAIMRNPSLHIPNAFPDEILALTQSIVEGITDHYEKARAISNWVSRNISYGLATARNDALSILEHRMGVCEGFSNLTVVLLRSVGIPSIDIHGAVRVSWFLEDQIVSHAWVEAHVDDRWIIIDPTWMAADRHRYFDISLQEVSRSHRYRNVSTPVLINGLAVVGGMTVGTIADTGNVTEVTVPDNVTFISDTARVRRHFGEVCTLRPFPSLERLVLPEGFITLNTAVFSQSSLSEIVLPESLERIGYSALAETNLSEISFPKNLISIDDKAFAETGLSVVFFPGSLRTIGRFAFENAELYSAYIAPVTSSISTAAFAGNPNLTIYGHAGSEAESHAAGEGIPFVVVESFEIAGDFAIDGDTLLFPMFDREHADHIEIPDGITAIGKNAFRNFASLVEFSIPSNIESVGSGAFAGSTSLDAVFIPQSVTYIGSDVFGGIEGLTIYGNVGTAAEVHALEHGIEFVNATALREPAEIIEDVPDEMPHGSEPAQDYFLLFVIGGSVSLIVIILVVVLRVRKRAKP